MLKSFAFFKSLIVWFIPNLSYIQFILIATFLVQCTIEKRVHNRGYFIERKKSINNLKSEREEILTTSESEVLRCEPYNLVEFNKFENSSEINTEHSISEIENEPSIAVTIPVSDTVHDRWTYQKKKKTLIGVGSTALVSGIVAGALLSEATAAGASLAAITFFGLIGWTLAIIAAILVILFIIFISIPARDRPRKETRGNLSKGERTALTALLIVFGVVGLFFLISNL